MVLPIVAVLSAEREGREVLMCQRILYYEMYFSGAE